jgi:hypothetical protein
MIRRAKISAPPTAMTTINAIRSRSVLVGFSESNKTNNEIIQKIVFLKRTIQFSFFLFLSTLPGGGGWK